MEKELKITDIMVGDWVDVRNDAAPNTPYIKKNHTSASFTR